MTHPRTTGFVIASVAAARGAAWLIDAVRFFCRSPAAWIGATVLMFIIYACLSFLSMVPLLPVIGSVVVNVVVNIVLFTLLGGVMTGCRRQETEGEFPIDSLFSGFTMAFQRYVLLGVLYSVGMLLLLAVMFLTLVIALGGTGFIADLQSGDPALLMPLLFYLVLALLVAMLFLVPLMMLFWFAPALVALADQGAVAAMIHSFRACLANVVPYLVYGVVGLVFCIIATIPLMLGWLVLTPVLIISVYKSYRDVFPDDTGAGE